MIVPHVAVVGRALEPRVLVIVGFQSLIHVNVAAKKALRPNDDDDNNVDDNSANMMMLMLIIIMMIVPIEITLVGIVTDASDVHPWKAKPSNNRNRVKMMIVDNNNDTHTNSSDTSRNSNRCK